MAERVLRRPIVLIAALLVASAALVAISVSESRAGSHVLTAADTIVLDIGAEANQLRYGSTVQPLVPGASNCKLSDASVEGPIMAITATSVDKKGADVPDSPVGLVDDGLGTSEKGNGNGQDCGLVDAGESITFSLVSANIGSRLIESMSLDLEGKFGGGAMITYYLDETPIGVDRVSLSNKGSDSGPDAREGDNYYFNVLPKPENAGILFDAFTIEPDDALADPGSVSVQSGTDWPVPADNLTVFNLTDALDCGDSLESGGPFEADNPLASFYLGPTKGGEPCAVPVELTTSVQPGEDGDEQIVSLVPPAGSSWEGVGISGLLTIEWDVEAPDDEAIDRTYVVTAGGPVVIPWCEALVPYQLSSNGWSYELTEPPAGDDGRYPEAVDDTIGLCLLDQSTATVFYDDEDAETPNIWTQTTELYYIFEDPILTRF